VGGQGAHVAPGYGAGEGPREAGVERSFEPAADQSAEALEGPAAVDAVCARHPQVRAVAGAEALVAENLDILSPCALGGTLNERVVDALTARIVCGGANNQLAHHGIEKLLADRGILYAPDYVVNSGGVIQVADELAGFSFERARAATEQIFVTTGKVLAIADADGVPPSVAADRLAERRMAEVGRLRGIWLGTMGSA